MSPRTRRLQKSNGLLIGIGNSNGWLQEKLINIDFVTEKHITLRKASTEQSLTEDQGCSCRIKFLYK